MQAEPYQIEGAEHMFATLDPHRRAPRSCLLLSDPGVGKTVQACTFLNWVDVPAVVCCNAGVDALASGGMDDFEIPAFLRKQAD